MTVWLVEVDAYDPDTRSVIQVRYSLGSKTPKYDGKHWPARLASAPTFSAVLFDTDPTDVSGTFRAVSPISILIGDGDNDDLRGYSFEGRDITIYRGQEGDTFAQFDTVMQAKVERVSWTREEFTMEVSDFSALLSVPAQENTYGGTGGTDGNADLKGLPKPRVLGRPRNVEPTLLDPESGLYQVSDGAMSAVDAVYAGAAELTLKSDSAASLEYLQKRPDGTTLYRTPKPETSFFPTFGSWCLSSNGRHLYVEFGEDVVGDGTREKFIGWWEMSRPYDFSSLRLLPKNIIDATDLTGEGYSLEDDLRVPAISSDGESLFTLVGTKLYQIDMDTPYDLSTASYTSGNVLDLSGTEVASISRPEQAVFSDDGTSLYLVDGFIVGTTYVYQIKFSTAYDISTASYTSGDRADLKSLSSMASNDSMLGLAFNGDGTECYILGSNGGFNSTSSANGTLEVGFIKFSLSTAWEINTAAWSSGDSQMFWKADVGGVYQTSPTGLVAYNDGKAVVYAQGVRRQYEPEEFTLKPYRMKSAYGLVDTDDIMQVDEYATDVASGILIANPARLNDVVTIDAQGETDGGSVIETAADLVRHLVGQELNDPADLDTQSFTDTNTSNSAEVSLYLSTEDDRRTILDACQELMSGIGGAIRPGTDGKFGVQVIDFGTSEGTISDDIIIQDTFQRAPPARPAWRVAVGYARAWRPLRSSEINQDSADAADAEFQRVPFRVSEQSDTAVQTRNLRAVDRQQNTVLDDEADASTEAQRRLDLMGPRRDEYSFSVKGKAFTYSVGQTWSLRQPDTRIKNYTIINNTGACVTANNGSCLDNNGLIVILKSVNELQDGETEISAWG